MNLSKYDYITLEMAEEEKEQRRAAREKKKEQESNTTFWALIIACMIMGPIWFYAMSVILAGTSVIEYIEMIPAGIILIPVVYILGSAAHSSFYTGALYRKKDDRPEKVWL